MRIDEDSPGRTAAREALEEAGVVIKTPVLIAWLRSVGPTFIAIIARAGLTAL